MMTPSVFFLLAYVFAVSILLTRTVDGSLLTRHPNISSSSYADNVSDLEFDTHTLFAETQLQLLLQIAGDMQKNDKSYYYNPAFLRMILRSSAWAGPKLNRHRRHADRSFESHGIGTASCAVRAGLHPVSVAALIAHGVYTNSWDDSAGWKVSWTPCMMRLRAMKALGTSVEKRLWLFTVLTGHGPNEAIFHGIAEEMRKDFAKFDNSLDRELLLMLLCDEVEEHVGGIQWLTRNWKNRSATFYEDALYIAKVYNNEEMGKILEMGFASTKALQHTAITATAGGSSSDKKGRMRHVLAYIDGMMEKTQYPIRDSRFRRIDFLQEVYSLQMRLRHSIARAWHATQRYFEALDCKAQGSFDQPRPAGWDAMRQVFLNTANEDAR